MDNLDRLRLFVAIAEAGSFAEAARALRVSAASASRAVAALEQSLGVELFRRTTRSVRLTDAGLLLVDRCRQAIGQLDDAMRLVAGENPEPRGLLVVSAPIVFGRMHISPVVVQLMRTHPGLDVRLSLTDRLVRIVDEGIDIAVRIAHLADSSLRAKRIGEVTPVLVASPAYFENRGVPREPKHLVRHDLIAFEPLTLNGEWRFGGSRTSALRIEPRLLTNNVDVAIDAAQAGVGIARVFDYQVRDRLAAGRLQTILDDHALPPVPVNLLYAATRQASANVRTFIRAVDSCSF